MLAWGRSSLLSACSIWVTCTSGCREAPAPATSDRVVTLERLPDSMNGFSPIRHAQELAGGQLLMLQPRAVVIVNFDTHQVDTLGRQGEGPGEYHNPMRVGVVGNLPVALDGIGLRLVAWSPDAMKRLASPALAAIIDPMTLVIDSSGRMVGLTSERVTILEQPALIRRVLVAVAGTTVDTLATVHVPGYLQAASVGPLAGAAATPSYSATDAWGVLPNGHTWWLRCDSLRLGWRAPDATTWRWGPPQPWAPIRTVASDRISFVGAKSSAGEDTVVWRPIVDAMGPFARAMASPDGEVWAQLNSHRGVDTTHMLFWQATGNSSPRHVMLPASRTLLAIGRTTLYVTAEADDGTVRIERYRRPY